MRARPATFVRAILLVLLLSSLPAWAQDSVERDEFGGLKGVRRAATGYFRTTRAEGGWWLVDPSGFLFRSVGVNRVSVRQPPLPPDRAAAYREAALSKYRTDTAWASATSDQLRGWNFNTIGPGSDPPLWNAQIAYILNLNCSKILRRQDNQAFPDIFAPVFEQSVRRHTQRVCRPRASDRWLLGYITDDPLSWGPDDQGSESLIAVYLGLSDDAPGRRELLRFLERRYLNISELNAAWRTDYASFEEIGRTPQVGSRIPRADADAFLRTTAAEYFRIVHDSIRAVDKYHLILGPRFVGRVPRPVLEAMDEYVNVVSLDCCASDPPADALREIHRVSGWPVLITRFGPFVDEAAPPSTPLDPTDAAERYEGFIRQAMDLPMVVGYSWFSYVDSQPSDIPALRKLPLGLVDLSDDPHPKLVDSVARVNGDVYAFGR